MMKIWLIFSFYLLILFASILADDETETNEDITNEDESSSKEDVEKKITEKSLEDQFQDSMKGFGSFFKNAGDEVKEKSESGFGSLFGFASGMSDKFNKAKAKVEEAGQKMKATVEESGSNVKDEVESAASKVSSQGRTALSSMMGLFK